MPPVLSLAAQLGSADLCEDWPHSREELAIPGIFPHANALSRWDIPRAHISTVHVLRLSIVTLFMCSQIIPSMLGLTQH